MKRVFTFLAALAICGSLFAQAPYRLSSDANSTRLVNYNTGKGLAAPGIAKAISPYDGYTHPTTRGTNAFWLCYSFAADSYAINNYSSTPSYVSDYMFSDSTVWIKYSNGNFRPFIYCLGDVFDPYAKDMADYYGHYLGYSLPSTAGYRVDSMGFRYSYDRFNTSTSVVDTLHVSFFTDSLTGNILTYKYISVHKNNSSTSKTDTVHVNNVPTLNYDNKLNRAHGTAAKYVTVTLNHNDTGFYKFKSWPINMHVPAGSQIASSISYKTGATWKTGDTLNKTMNALRVYGQNELGQDSLAVINDFANTGLNFSSLGTKFNRYHLIHGQLDSLFIPAQLWTAAINFNHHIIWYHLVLDFTGVDNITQTIKNVGLYPNPSNTVSNLTFDANNAGRVRVLLYDVTGRLVNTVADYTATTGKQNIDINTQNLNTGVYFVTVQDGNNTQLTQKLVVSH